MKFSELLYYTITGFRNFIIRDLTATTTHPGFEKPRA